MRYYDHLWSTLSVLIAIPLFATVIALTTQIIFGRNFATLFVGPAIAIVSIIALGAPAWGAQNQ
jgi:hypothetical protein